MGGKEGQLVLQDVAAGTGSEHEDDSESEPENSEPLLETNGRIKSHVVTEDLEKIPATERIRASTVKTLTYIRDNKRKLTATAVLWFAFLMTMMSISLLAPFFPQEVSRVSVA